MRLIKSSGLVPEFFFLLAAQGTYAQSAPVVVQPNAGQVSLSANTPTQDRAALLQEIQSSDGKDPQLEAAFLAPSPEDQAKYSEFLKTPGTGLCRLMPGDKYVKTLAVRGGGAYYSVLKLTHEYGYGSEIGLAGDGKLYTSFAGADLGLIASVGDIPLETVGLENPVASVLLTYQPPLAEEDAQAEYLRLTSGIELGTYVFNRSALAQVNNTYVLRTVNYNDCDVITAVRVVGQDPDGSITVLWKILKELPKPTLIISES
jgi:hypothetical protein